MCSVSLRDGEYCYWSSSASYQGRWRKRYDVLQNTVLRREHPESQSPWCSYSISLKVQESFFCICRGENIPQFLRGWWFSPIVYKENTMKNAQEILRLDTALMKLPIIPFHCSSITSTRQLRTRWAERPRPYRRIAYATCLPLQGFPFTHQSERGIIR